MNEEEKEARKLIAISAASRAFQYMERFPNATENEVMQHVTNNVDDILDKIDDTS